MITLRRLFFTRKGQSTLEYAVLIAIIGAGLVMLSTYVRRGYQGRLRSQSDNLGEQFEPGKTTYEYVVDSSPVTVSNYTDAQGNVKVDKAGGRTNVDKDYTSTPWEK